MANSVFLSPNSLTLPANGGTGLSSYAIGDLLYASAATTLASLADVATGQVLTSGGVGVAPAWSASPTLTSVLVAVGSAGAPSLAVGDAANGFWRSATNQVSVSTNGAHRWAWTTTGHLIAATPNAFDIGGVGNEARTGYFSTSVVTATVNATTAFQINGNTFPTATVGPSAPTGTTSTTLVMAGLAGSITTRTGRVVFTMSGYLTDNTANDGTKAQISYGTGTAPVNGAALTGTQVGPVVQYSASTLAAGASAPYAATWIVTGLSVGTAYWFDTAFAAITGGTGSIVQASMTAQDIP